MKEWRLYRCSKGHEEGWMGDPEGVLIGNIKFISATPDMHMHFTSVIHAPSLGFPSEICSARMELVEREELSCAT